MYSISIWSCVFMILAVYFLIHFLSYYITLKNFKFSTPDKECDEFVKQFGAGKVIIISNSDTLYALSVSGVFTYITYLVVCGYLKVSVGLLVANAFNCILIISLLTLVITTYVYVLVTYSDKVVSVDLSLVCRLLAIMVVNKKHINYGLLSAILFTTTVHLEIYLRGVL